MGSDSSSMWDRPLTPPEQEIRELPVVAIPPPVPGPSSLLGRLSRALPRFSLLTLLLMMTLIALGAAFVAMKSSLEQQLREQQQNHWAEREQVRQAQDRILNLTLADQRILSNIAGAPSLSAVGLLQVRGSSEQPGLYDIVLILDPQKNYALHWQHLGKDQQTIQKQSGIIRRIVSPHPARQALILKFDRGGVFTRVSNLNPTDVFEGTVSCQPVLLTYYEQANGSNLQTRPLYPRITLPNIKVILEPGLTTLRQCYTKEQWFLDKKVIELFTVQGFCQERVTDHSLELTPVEHSLTITLEEHSDADLGNLQQTVEFGR